jgi:adenylosuccinate synthase
MKEKINISEVIEDFYELMCEFESIGGWSDGELEAYRNMMSLWEQINDYIQELEVITKTKNS